MVDKKVYKTDYQSEATRFIEGLAKQAENPAVKSEVDKYDEVFNLRDNPSKNLTRKKFW